MYCRDSYVCLRCGCADWFIQRQNTSPRTAARFTLGWVALFVYETICLLYESMDSTSFNKSEKNMCNRVGPKATPSHDFLMISWLRIKHTHTHTSFKRPGQDVLKNGKSGNTHLLNSFPIRFLSPKLGLLGHQGEDSSDETLLNHDIRADLGVLVVSDWPASIIAFWNQKKHHVGMTGYAVVLPQSKILMYWISPILIFNLVMTSYVIYNNIYYINPPNSFLKQKNRVTCSEVASTGYVKQGSNSYRMCFGGSFSHWRIYGIFTYAFFLMKISHTWLHDAKSSYRMVKIP